MGQKYWIKLYLEILDDPKMGTLPDRLYRRVIELFLIAGAERNEGKLPSLESMAWKLRLSQDELLADLGKIEPTGIVSEIEPGIWLVTKFSERQAPSDPTAVTRMQHYRERNAQRNNPVTPNEPVTPDVTEPLRVTLRVDSRIESDIDRDAEGGTHDPFDAMRILVETMTGYPIVPNQAEAKAINQFIAMGATKEDIQDALAFFSGNGMIARGPASLLKSVQTAVAKRTQKTNGKPAAKPYIPEEHASEVY